MRHICARIARLRMSCMSCVCVGVNEVRTDGQAAPLAAGDARHGVAAAVAALRAREMTHRRAARKTHERKQRKRPRVCTVQMRVCVRTTSVPAHSVRPRRRSARATSHAAAASASRVVSLRAGGGGASLPPLPPPSTAPLRRTPRRSVAASTNVSRTCGHDSARQAPAQRDACARAFLHSRVHALARRTVRFAKKDWSCAT
jgi:hypothetical protein